MKKDDILDAISGIKDEYINEAVPGAARRKSSVWAKAGVIAACLCLFAAVGFLIPYGMNKPAVKPPVDTDTVGSGVATTVSSTNETTGMVEDSTDTGEIKNYWGFGGGDYPCNVHHTVYHMIPSEIIELVGGNEAIEEWITNNTSGDTTDSECPMLSIKQVIDAFDITEDEFAEACNLVFYPYYDLDVLFNGSIEEADMLYRDMEWVDAQGTLMESYLNLRDAIEVEYSSTIKTKAVDIYANSIPNLVKILEINREALEKIVKEISDHGNKAVYEFNLDMLYGVDGEIVFETSDDISKFELDEKFCRIGRYAE